ncbi:MAG: hypothetical protein KatS3mg105_2431 [Gemmatales bacterium]|nr:MAG: hypothetical protein KatS3mg105_2431 [Gemmatales bacterium]
MRYRVLRCFSLVAIMCFVIPFSSAQDKTKPAPKPEKPKRIVVGQGQVKFVRLTGDEIEVLVRVPVRKGRGIQYKEQKQSFPIAKDVQVRVKNPPLAFDSKGRPKKWTADELQKFKGPDPKAWGYTGSLNMLKQNQTIHAFLGKERGAPRDAKPEIFMIYILDDVVQ